MPNVYDFWMTLDEVLGYIEQRGLPERFGTYDSEGFDDNKVLEYYKEQIAKSNEKG